VVQGPRGQYTYHRWSLTMACAQESDPKPPYSPIERTMPHRARASHNIRCDTEAARIVLGDPSVRVQVVSNDVTCRCWFEGLHSVALVKAGGPCIAQATE